MGAVVPVGINDFEIDISRDGNFWLIHIPELDGYTQARRLNEIDYMARDYIALVTHAPIEDISVHLRHNHGDR